MRLITAGFTFLLSLSACEQALSVSSVVRDSANGVDRLYSEARVRKGVGKFECHASSSGLCHYAVFDRDCADGRCTDKPLVFSVAVGSEAERRGMPEHPRICVDAERAPQQDCAPK